MFTELDQQRSVDDAFSKQSTHFDEDELSNPILHAWRQRIYNHVDVFIKPSSRILELNAGTGIDAVRFAKEGHTVHATDISSGMIQRLKEKIIRSDLSGEISVQQLSYDQLDQVSGKFDHIFSNFGGLNCIDDLTKVTRHLPNLLNKGAFVTLVIMPRIAPWEWSWVLKGKFNDAFRRFKKGGVMAHLEGEYFRTYYHSLSTIEKSFGPRFQLIKLEGLGILSPPPSALNFVKRFPSTSRFLNNSDRVLASMPLLRQCGDHIIVTLSFKD